MTETFPSNADFALIDSVIFAWVEKHSFKLFTGYQGFEHIACRNVYFSSSKGECCQIWVDPPRSEMVALHAADVETHMDEELRHDWSVPVEKLDAALDDALAFVRKWMDRIHD
jgi:hypothetical protein